MEKRWHIKKQGDAESVKLLAEKLNINNHLANLLVQRGITDFEGAKNFFRPQLSDIHDPFLMKDMDKAVQRIKDAIKNNEKILVYGDYDVDGTTAVAMVYLYLKNIYSNVDFYIPDRDTEGYGISIQGIDFAEKNEFSLVIALDCGIKAVEKIEYAKSKQIDFIICDHHRPGKKMPDAYAVLDPKREDCNYPFKELSGCGVGFKLIQEYNQKTGEPFKNLEKYLDLVVTSIASDIVPVTGENRILAYYGLKILNSNPRPGIEAILRYSNVIRTETNINTGNIFNRELTINDLVFLVGPRINAAGRIESAKNSVELLISENIDSAERVAEQINTLNTERRNLDTQITQQALDMISSNEKLKNSKTTVVFNSGWHKGVIGIVASRLTETYYRPTIVLTKSNDFITGSARSVKDFDIYDAVDACSDLLEHFGGHKYAAGLSLKEENLNAFQERFENVVSDTIEDHMLIPEVEIDAKLNLNDINNKFYRILKQFAPFGPNNMTPMFQTNGLIDTGYARIVGNNHLKLNVVHRDISGYPVSAIAFQQGEHIEYIKKGIPFDICYHIEENNWNNKTTIQLNIKDIKPAV
ncbi:MAG: single-stranded-DNA-specific exonuclease RecJ [Bacteroidales bacterium]|nr:single-stranded-DNA-specific exonuclease RecJ [Bacteroidales bacterium]